MFSIRASVGEVTPQTTDFSYILNLMDPCPNTSFTIIDAEPFDNMKYKMGEDYGPISQPYDVASIVELETQLECGLIDIEFTDGLGNPLSD